VHGGRGPQQPARHGQKLRQGDPAEGPGFEQQHQTGQHQEHGLPLPRRQTLTQPHPRERQRPEGHGEGQDGRLAGITSDHGQRHQAEEGGGLQQTEDDRLRDTLRPQIDATHGQHDEENHGTGRHPKGNQIPGIAVVEGDLDRHPVVTPHEGQQHQRQPAGSFSGEGEGHRLAELR